MKVQQYDTGEIAEVGDEVEYTDNEGKIHAGVVEHIPTYVFVRFKNDGWCVTTNKLRKKTSE